MTLSPASVFARLGNDPWLEAGRLARLPKSEATESLTQIIANMPSMRLAATGGNGDCHPFDRAVGQLSQASCDEVRQHQSMVQKPVAFS